MAGPSEVTFIVAIEVIGVLEERLYRSDIPKEVVSFKVRLWTSVLGVLTGVVCTLIERFPVPNAESGENPFRGAAFELLPKDVLIVLLLELIGCKRVEDNAEEAIVRLDTVGEPSTEISAFYMLVGN